MKKIVLMIGLLITMLCVNFVVSADEGPSVTLTLNGQSGEVSMQTQQTCVVVVKAPGATAVRVFNPNLWDEENDPEGENCWDYFDRYHCLTNLEFHERYGIWGAGYIVAQARYDDYEDGLDFWQETWDENESPWTVQSNMIRLNLTSNGKDMPAPDVTLDKTTAARGEWITASIGQTLGLDEWYWADLFKVNTDGNDWDWYDHFDFNLTNQVAVPIVYYEPGSYCLKICSTAQGYENNGEKDLFFTVTDGTASDPLMLNKTSVVTEESIFFVINTPGVDHPAIRITKEDNPSWYDYRNWYEPFSHDTQSFGESGTYHMVLINQDDGAVIDSEEITVTSSGKISRPNLSDLPVLLTVGESFTGSIGLDEKTDSFDVNVNFISDDSWDLVYQSHREKGDEVWNELIIPGDLLSRPGTYNLDVNARARLNYNSMGTNLHFIVREEAETDTLTLKVNGSTENNLSCYSSTNLSIDAYSENATAIRLLRDGGWWDTQDSSSGHAHWNIGYGDGDYAIVAQMTTAEPVWREDGFDWGNFNWNDLPWTDYSNTVKVHVSSRGELAVPAVTLDPADGQVERGEFLTVTVEEQPNIQWIWAELRTLNENDTYNHYFENVENGHFDSDSGSLSMRIPTMQIEPGDYYLVVGADAQNWTGKETYVPVTITEASQPLEATMILSADTIQTGENLKIYVWAPGSYNADLQITWDRDAYWRDHRGTGGEYEVWDWGCGGAGEYTFDLTIRGPEGEQHIVKSLNVTSEGKLENPVLTGVPDMIDLSDGIIVSFQEIEGAEWYDVDLHYVPEQGDWEQLYWDRRDPGDPGSTEIVFDPGYFYRTGSYRLSVNAGAIGVDNGYAECSILVLSSTQVSDDLILTVNGETDTEKIVDVYLYQSVRVALQAPESVTAARVWDKQHGWDYWTGPVEEKSNYMRYWNAHEESMTLVAQATTDQSVKDWGMQHNGDFNGFDWDKVNWSLTSNSVSFVVTCLGEMEAPNVVFPNGTTVERGNELTISFEEVENAYAYGIIIETMDGYRLYDSELGKGGTYSFLTDTFRAGSYRLIVDPRHFGYRGYQAVHVITVTETDWSDQPVYKISKTQVLTNEHFGVAVYAPGALEISVINKNQDDFWEWGYSRGDSLTDSMSCKTAGDFLLQAFARYSEEGDWVQVGEDIVVTAEAPYGTLPVSFEGKEIGSVSDDYTFIISVQKRGLWFEYLPIELYSAADDSNRDLLPELAKAGHLNVNETETDDVYTSTLTIAAGALQEGRYRVDSHVEVSIIGYEWSGIEEYFMITNNNELPGPKIWMDGVWEEGQDLKFYVDPMTAKYVRVVISDKETGAVVYKDEEDNFDDWNYNIPASKFVPGKFYGLEVTTHQDGYNDNQTVFDICMMPSSLDTMFLPSDLMEISANAFEGIKAQKIVIPDGVTSIGENAFANCPNLLLVEIPKSTEGIHTNAFAGSGPFMAYGDESQWDFGFRVEGGTFIYLKQ